MCIMAIVKLSSSKKSVQFIDDSGNVFFSSVNYLLGLLNGKAPTGFIYLKRLPIPISMSRFKPSEVWDPDGIVNSKTLEPVTLSNDGLNANRIKEKDKKEMFKDKVVW